MGLMVCNKLAWCTLSELGSSMLEVCSKLSLELRNRYQGYSREKYTYHPECSRKASNKMDCSNLELCKGWSKKGLCNLDLLVCNIEGLNKAYSNKGWNKVSACNK